MYKSISVYLSWPQFNHTPIFISSLPSHLLLFKPTLFLLHDVMAFKLKVMVITDQFTTNWQNHITNLKYLDLFSFLLWVIPSSSIFYNFPFVLFLSLSPRHHPSARAPFRHWQAKLPIPTHHSFIWRTTIPQGNTSYHLPTYCTLLVGWLAGGISSFTRFNNWAWSYCAIQFLGLTYRPPHLHHRLKLSVLMPMAEYQ